MKKEAQRRRLSRRDTDEQVKEAALRHLGDADDIDIHHKLVDGSTLHDTMVEHKRLSQMSGSKKKCRFSAKYMLALREKLGVKSMLEELVVVDATEDASKELRTAVDPATKKNVLAHAAASPDLLRALRGDEPEGSGRRRQAHAELQDRWQRENEGLSACIHEDGRSS